MTRKKAASLMLSYVLLVLIALAMATLIYVWMRNLPPEPGEACPEGVSIIIRNVQCDTVAQRVTLILANKGRFDIHGLVIRASDDANVAPIINLDEVDGKIDASTGMNLIVDATGNIDPLEPDEEESYQFTYSGILTNAPVTVSAGVVRLQEEDPVVCTNTFVSSPVTC